MSPGNTVDKSNNKKEFYFIHISSGIARDYVYGGGADPSAGDVRVEATKVLSGMGSRKWCPLKCIFCIFQAT